MISWTWLSDLHSLWHAYRIPILFLISAAALVIRGFIYVQETRGRQSRLSRSSSPTVVERRAGEVIQTERKKVEDVETRVLSGNIEDQEMSVPAKLSQTASIGLPKRIRGKKRVWTSGRGRDEDEPCAVHVLLFFFSLTGHTEPVAKSSVEKLSASLAISSTREKAAFNVQLLDLSQVDYDDYFISPLKTDEKTARNVKYFYLFLIPTYNIDTILNTFLAHLQETHHDFRIDNAPLSSLLGYSVFGFGDRETWPTEQEGFCSQARDLDKWMAKLTGGKRAFPLGMGDVKSDAEERLREWEKGVEEVIRIVGAGDGLGEGVMGSGDAMESDEEIEEGDETSSPLSTARKSQNRRQGVVDDVEEIGRTIQSADDDSRPLLIDFTTNGQTSGVTSSPTPPKEMVPRSSPTYAALTKQGYTIVGSHSGVKICRWTKSALRGRGSCYKFSFYGIKSHLCMETTPSLSCSNKCVFCWRHGTNPVGTTWRWQVDPPEMIFEGAKEGHYQKIRMMRGIPGVRADRFAEAFRIRHCALSLVGEPIFYPHINRFVGLLHRERISTFLVCNAQHPDQLAALEPVTQLYVSIDASNRESLRRIDRPLHRDFWERFQRCLDILRENRFRQRTVFRLTLVKGFNIDDEVQGYADLVARALPCFIEIKGVTFCGTSTSSSQGLRMSNVPFYCEITDFVRALNDELEKRDLEYGIAAEHAHSCCVLIASKRFNVDGKWHTLIDYDRFFDLLKSGKPFTPEEYMGSPTPEWATWGNGGFDPADQRVFRKKKKVLN
ncbi:MAG: hypothetical protein M1816_005487 [Peltula sp. TS41687]|nr:MAG: hypothetical protein M1816_005487 [Peltula sp. TS41687]